MIYPIGALNYETVFDKNVLYRTRKAHQIKNVLHFSKDFTFFLSFYNFLHKRGYS